MNYVERIEKNAINSFNDLANEIVFSLVGFIASEMGLSKTSESWKSGSGAAFPDSQYKKNTTNILRAQSNKLIKSFLRGTDSHTNINISKKNISLIIGSKLPYAAIHEYGGKIKAKKKSDSKLRYAMAGKMWGKYIASGNIAFKKIALSIKKKGFVKIPKREYFKIGFANFISKDYANIMNDYLKFILDS